MVKSYFLRRFLRQFEKYFFGKSQNLMTFDIVKTMKRSEDHLSEVRTRLFGKLAFLFCEVHTCKDQYGTKDEIDRDLF